MYYAKYTEVFQEIKMNKYFVVAMFFMFITVSEAMHHETDPYAVSCPITIRLQVPVPTDKSPGPGMDNTALISYLKTPSLDMNSIPLRLYDSIITTAPSAPIDGELTNALLSIWGINDSSIFEEREKTIPEFIKNICEILAEVKEAVKKEES